MRPRRQPVPAASSTFGFVRWCVSCSDEERAEEYERATPTERADIDEYAAAWLAEWGLPYPQHQWGRFAPSGSPRHRSD